MVGNLSLLDYSGTSRIAVNAFLSCGYLAAWLLALSVF
jgi:hypothetical protein